MRLWIVALFMCTPAFAQFAPVPLGKASTSLLDGRLYVALPQRAMVEGLPSADEDSKRHVTRVAYEESGVHFIVSAEELYAFAGADPQAAATRYAAGDHPAPFAVPSGLKVLAFAPNQQGAPEQENIIYVALVVHPDGTVVQLGFFVDAAGLNARAKWIALAQQIVRSVVAGSRKLDLAAADRTFPGVKDDKLALTLPAGWVSMTENGPDFSVYRIHKVGELGGATTECGIYLGAHPSLMHEANPATAQLKPTSGKLLGHGAKWFTWQAGPDEWTTEAIATHPLDPVARVHAFCSAASEAELKTPRLVIDTLRINK